MQTNAFTLEAKGILSAIRIPVTIISQDGKRECATAIWDTGADITRISKRLVEELGIKSMGERLCYTAMGTTTSKHYSVSVLLPNDIEITDLSVFDFAGAPDCDVLIGMDVICRGDLAISNATNTTWVSFRSPPDKEHIDFKSA